MNVNLGSEVKNMANHAENVSVIDNKLHNKKIGSKLKKLFVPFKNPIVIIAFILLVIECLSLLFALFWALGCSFKSLNDFSENIFGLPQKWKIENYFKVYNNLYFQKFASTGYVRYYFPELFLNTVLYATFPVVVKVVSLATCAYAVSKYNFKFNKVIITTVMFVVIYPGVTSVGQRIQFLKAIGFYDSYWALLYGNIMFADYPFLIWLGTFNGISKEYMEAAKIDGASNLQTMLRIMFPLARTVFAIYLILGFIGAWNDYMIPLQTMPSMPNLAFCLYQFKSNTINEIAWPMYSLAAAIFVAIPCFICYCFISPFLVGNLTMGGVKE